MSTESTSKENAIKQSKIRHASQLSGSLKKSGAKPESVSEYVKISKAVLDFTIATLLAQRALLEELAKLSDDEKVETLFELLDNDGDGAVDATELADGLRKIRGDVNFEESLILAIDRVATFDTQGKGKLILVDFKTMATSLCEALGTSFHELSELFLMSVLFEDGNTFEENVVGAIVADSITEVVKDEEAARKAMVDARMKALFALFDSDDNDSIDLKEVVIGMYRITANLEDASKAALVALMLFDDDSTRSLNYEQFGKFILNVLAASPQHITFDDVADALVLSASQETTMSAEDMAKILMLEETLKEVLDLKEEAEKHMSVTNSQLARSNNLFKLWDLDSDGAIDIKELALGLKKFEETSSMKTTVAEAVELMGVFDLDGNQALSKQEFIIFLVQFAKSAGVDLDEMLDFMIVTSGLKENSEAELKYVQALTANDLYSFCD